jgi:23S rRNA (cytidine1920-2'-O)/16S rRNA (cytidine1409-2'-O)-methyltransferase
MKQIEAVGNVSGQPSGPGSHAKISIMTGKERVDQLLVGQGLAQDLDEARRLVMAGKVLCRGQLIFKASQTLPKGEKLELSEDPPFASRGGEKLQAAFQAFPLSVSGAVCADVGASTGGFTDCLLQQGAARVYAIDVGYGLLDWRLRNDPRVVPLERTNARNLQSLPEPVEFITADVSFISLSRILPAMAGWFIPQGGQAVVLVKPQFEASREESALGEGVIRDPGIHKRVLEEVLSKAYEEGFLTRGLLRSPLQGPAGNQEFLAWLSCPKGEGEADQDLAGLISPLF